ncbi:MAG: DNA alkylation repair protein [Planctomycetia bacterium]|nr:DNA alkylation repair protein [Planctomycetia bacterium]
MSTKSPSIREKLQMLAEEPYRKFALKLLPGQERFLGVRIPHLRKMAQKIARKDWQNFLAHPVSEPYFEETLLRGLVLGYAPATWEERLPWLEKFIPEIDNWSVCDSFCATLKIARDEPEKVWSFLEKYLISNHPFECRFAVVMLLMYFLREDYLPHVFQRLETVRCQDYYAQMAVAWAVSLGYFAFPSATQDFLQKKTLPPTTRRKTIQKILESQRLSKTQKQKLRKWSQKIL